MTAVGAQLSTIHAIVIDVDADRATQKLPHATVAAPAELLAASALFVGCFDMVYHHHLYLTAPWAMDPVPVAPMPISQNVPKA